MPPETVATIAFWVFAVIAVGFALAVVTTARILRAAVYLAGLLVASAAFYLLLRNEFLAGVQILVYVGGIVVLLVYAIMLTTSMDLREERPHVIRRLNALAASAAFFAITVFAMRATEFKTAPDAPPPESDVAEIGRRLFDVGADGYVLPFEIISLLLLAVLIGGVVVARKNPPEQN
jgi:NADH-quinone oxidoreductase subunit J